MPCQTCGAPLGADGTCAACAATPPAAAGPSPVARPAWMAVVDLARTGLAGPVLVAAAALVGLGGELDLHPIWVATVIPAAALLLLGAMADHRRGAGTGTGLLSPVPQALAAGYVLAAAALLWDGRLVPLLFAVGGALVGWDALRRIRRGDLGPVRSLQELRGGVTVAGLLLAAVGLWGMHGTWWTTDSSLGGGYEYGYNYDSYAGGYSYSYEWSPTASYSFGGSGGLGEDDGYVILGGLGLLAGALALAHRHLTGRGRWLPLAALAAPVAYVAWSARLTSGYGAMVAWNYEWAGWSFALAGIAVCILGLVQVRRQPPMAAPSPTDAAESPPPPPF